MAEMSMTMVGASRKKGLPVDVGTFAARIEEQANTLAECGWTHEATHLRKWASELRGKSPRSDYSSERQQQGESTGAEGQTGTPWKDVRHGRFKNAG